MHTDICAGFAPQAEIASRFPIDGEVASISQIKSGHINETYLVTTHNGSRYILQWINRYVFPNVEAIMQNMSAISAFLREHHKGKMAMISYMDTLDGHNYYDDGKGGAWRLYRFVPDSICLQRAETAEDFYQSGVAFGALLGLADFRRDAFACGLHAMEIQRRYPAAEISMSLPRLRPAAHMDQSSGVSEARKRLEMSTICGV